MKWNYRVCLDENNQYSIHELYYDDHGDLVSWTKNSQTHKFDTIQELKDFIYDELGSYKMMLECFKKPTIELHEDSESE